MSKHSDSHAHKKRNLAIVCGAVFSAAVLILIWKRRSTDGGQVDDDS